MHKGNTYKIREDDDRENYVNPEEIFQSSSNRNEASEGTVAVINFAGDTHELDYKVNSMISKSENFIKEGKNMIKATICNYCGKEGKLTNIKDHIEANHLEGVSIPCNYCEQTFRSRHRMSSHKRTNHKNC